MQVILPLSKLAKWRWNFLRVHLQTPLTPRAAAVACPRIAVYLKNLVVVLIIALMSFLFTFSVNPFTTVFRAIINQSAIETIEAIVDWTRSHWSIDLAGGSESAAWSYER